MPSGFPVLTQSSAPNRSIAPNQSIALNWSFALDRTTALNQRIALHRAMLGLSRTGLKTGFGNEHKLPHEQLEPMLKSDTITGGFAALT